MLVNYTLPIVVVFQLAHKHAFFYPIMRACCFSIWPVAVVVDARRHLRDTDVARAILQHRPSQRNVATALGVTRAWYLDYRIASCCTCLTPLSRPQMCLNGNLVQSKCYITTYGLISFKYEGTKMWNKVCAPLNIQESSVLGVQIVFYSVERNVMVYI